MNRAYAVLDVKSFDASGRRFAGIATTPTPDRVDDVIEPLGIQFKNPLSLMLFHDQTQPVGTVTFGRPTAAGVPFEAVIPDVLEPGEVKTITDKAAHFVKYGLIRAVSIGFTPLNNAIEILKTGGRRFLKTEVLELSLVPIPANQEAVITTIKSICSPDPAASGAGPAAVARSSAGVSAPIVKAHRGPSTMKTIQEQITSFEATRQAKDAERTGLMTKAADAGETLDQANAETYDTLTTEIASIDAHIKRLRTLEESNASAATVVKGANLQDAAASRSGQAPVIQLKQTLPPGFGFARAVKVRLVSRLDGRNPLDIAKSMYPGDDRLLAHLAHQANLPNIISQIKGAVAGATTLDSTWAGALADPTNLAAEFIEFIRPETIIGKLNLRKVPFNVRMIEQSVGGTGYWVGQGAPKPLTKFGFAPVTMELTKVAAIAVATEESIRYSTPDLDMLVRNALRDALVERIDRDLLDPAEAGSTNVQPASLTNGLAPLSSAGVDPEDVVTDIGKVVGAIRTAQIRGPIVIVMPDSLGTAIAFQTNAFGQPFFPEAANGTIRGVRFITSQYLANPSGPGNMVVGIAEQEVFLADDGQVTVDASREASLEMLDNPTNNAATGTPTTSVSMWQTNSIAFRAERHINWKKRRSEAVAYLDDVNWGSVGSPS